MRNWEAVRCLVDALGDEEPQGGWAAGHGGVATHEIMVSKLDVAGIGDELGPERLEALLSLRMAALTHRAGDDIACNPTGEGFGRCIIRLLECNPQLTLSLVLDPQQFR